MRFNHIHLFPLSEPIIPDEKEFRVENIVNGDIIDIDTISEEDFFEGWHSEEMTTEDFLRVKTVWKILRSFSKNAN